MRCTLLLSLTLLATDAIPARAASPGEKPVAREQVEQLIQDLAHRSHRRRTSAYNRLAQMGPQIIPILRKATSHRDLEVRQRVGQLISTLQTRKLLAPTRISLQAKKERAVSTILDDLSNQTGYKIEHHGGSTPVRLAIDLKNVTFWQALEHLAKEGGMVLQQGYGDNRVRLSRQDARCPYVCLNGAFRFSANSFSQHRSINFGYVSPGQGPSRSNNLNFSFYAHVEPKMMILGYEGVKLTAAYDDRGNSMLPPKKTEPILEGPFPGRRNISRYGNGYNSVSVSLSANLVRPDPKAERVKLLRGRVPFTLLVEDEKVTVVDKVLTVKDKKIDVGKTSFHIESVKEVNNNQVQIKMTVSNGDVTNPNDYSWNNSLYRRIELVDQNGNKFYNNGSNWQKSTASSVEMIQTFGSPGNGVGKAAKLIYHEWKTMHHSVDFEFKNLPLP